MNKVKVSEIEFLALKSFDSYSYEESLSGILNQILYLKLTQGFVGEREALNKMELDIFVKALIIGYELKK